MAGRVTAFSSENLRRYCQEREAERRAMALARGKAVTKGNIVGVSRRQLEVLCEPVLDYGRYDALMVCRGVQDDGYCYTSLAAGTVGLAEVSKLGPSPAAGEVLSSPQGWFANPLPGAIVSAGEGSCSVVGGDLGQGVPMDTFLSAAAHQDGGVWPVGSLGNTLEPAYTEIGASADFRFSETRRGDLVVLDGPPSDLPAEVLVVSSSVGEIAGLRSMYPQCRVVGPGEIYAAEDVIFFSGKTFDPDGPLVRQVADGTSRVLVWCSVSFHVPDVFLRWQAASIARYLGCAKLRDLRLGPVTAESSSSHEAVGGFVDDDDYLFLCGDQAGKEVLRRWYPRHKEKVYTVAEAADRVVADVYLYTREVLSQSCPCPQVVVQDGSELMSTGLTNATRGFYLVDVPMYGCV